MANVNKEQGNDQGIELVNGRKIVKDGSGRSSKQSNEDANGDDENKWVEGDHYASLPPTPQSTGDDDDMLVTVEALGALHCDRDHAAFHLPTNLEIREGTDYQCPVQDWVIEDSYNDTTERENCVWRPTTSLNSTQINDYLSIALGCFNIEQDRAMFILQSSNYDIEEAKHELAKRQVKKEPWSDEDIAIFKQALQNYGKHFSKIRQLLPHKMVKEIVNFYYDNKKKMDFRSIIDTFLEEHSQRSSDSENDEAESSDKKPGPWCFNCEQTTNLRQLEDYKLCNACFTHFRNYHRHRPCLKPMTRDATVNESIKCPKGMIDIVERFEEFAAEEKIIEHIDSKAGNDDDLQIVEVIQAPQKRYIRILKEIERDEVLAKRNCVQLENSLRLQYEKLSSEDITRYRINQPSTSTVSGRTRYSPSWSYKEKWQALFAFQRYGKDFNAVAEVLDSKSPEMVKSFYYEMQQQIDDMVEKTNNYYQKLAETYDFERLTKVDVAKEEVINID